MGKKILSIVLVLLLLSNYCFVMAATELKYAEITSGTTGNLIKSIASVADDDYYLDGDYNADSIGVTYKDVKIYQYGTKKAQTQVGEILTEPSGVGTYTANKYYAVVTDAGKESGISDPTKDKILRYTIKIPGATESVEKVATFVYTGGLEYNGNTYDVQFNINEIRKQATSNDLIMGFRIGGIKIANYEGKDPKDINSYVDTVRPEIYAYAGDADTMVELDMDYVILESGKDTPAQICGMWGVTDVDNNEGIVIKDYQINSSRALLKSATQNADSLDYIRYKIVDDKDTIIYSTDRQDNSNGNVYLKMNMKEDNISKLNIVKTWNKLNAGAAFIFLDDAIKRFSNIYITVTNGTFTTDAPSTNFSGNNTKGVIKSITNGSSYSIGYKPLSGYRLKSIKVDGVALDATKLAENSQGYSFTDITDDHKIEIEYEAIPVTTANYTVKHYRANENGQYPDLDKPTETETKTGATIGSTVKATPKTTGEYAGYEVDESKDNVLSGKVTADGKLELRVYYKKPTGSYKVEHYYQEKNNEYTKKAEYTNVYTNKNVGDSITVTPRGTTGYVLNTEKSTNWTGMKVTKGEQVISLYYDILKYDINYEPNGGTKNPNNPDVYYTSEGVAKFEKPDNKPNREGYTFIGWYEDEELTKRIDSIPVGTKGEKTLWAKWEANKDIEFTIEHWLQVNDTEEYKLDEPAVKLTGTTGQKINGEDYVKTFSGYTFNKNHKGSVLTGEVKPDGSSVIKLYYDKIYCTVSFDPQNGKKIDDQKVPYGDKATEPSKQVNEGYEFKYWFFTDEDGQEKIYDFNNPVVKDIRLIAKWDKVVVPDTTPAPTPIPQTGDFNPIMVFSALAVVTLAGVFGIRYFKLNRYVK